MTYPTHQQIAQFLSNFFLSRHAVEIFNLADFDFTNLKKCGENFRDSSYFYQDYPMVIAPELMTARTLLFYRPRKIFCACLLYRYEYSEYRIMNFGNFSI